MGLQFSEHEMLQLILRNDFIKYAGLYVCLDLLMLFVVTFSEYVFHLNSHFLHVEIHLLPIKNLQALISWNTDDFIKLTAIDDLLSSVFVRPRKS